MPNRSRGDLTQDGETASAYGAIGWWCVKQARNQERAVSWVTWLKTEFRGHLVHPQPPYSCSFEASESPNEMPRPPYQWSLGGAGEPAHGWGQRWVHSGPRNEKMIFSKLFLVIWDAETSVFRPF